MTHALLTCALSCKALCLEPRAFATHLRADANLPASREVPRMQQHGMLRMPMQMQHAQGGICIVHQRRDESGRAGVKTL